MTTFGFHSTAEEVAAGVDLHGTTWLVTGCNSGIGKETARVLALRGARVVGGARSADKAREALDEVAPGGVPLACELSDLASVRAAVTEVSASGLVLDGLVANAGITRDTLLVRMDDSDLDGGPCLCACAQWRQCTAQWSILTVKPVRLSTTACQLLALQW